MAEGRQNTRAQRHADWRTRNVDLFLGALRGADRSRQRVLDIDSEALDDALDDASWMMNADCDRAYRHSRRVPMPEMTRHMTVGWTIQRFMMRFIGRRGTLDETAMEDKSGAAITEARRERDMVADAACAAESA